MADTIKIKAMIEPYVRGWLSKQFPGHVFEERPIQLTTGENYSCDALAEDASIIAAILSSRAKTRTGRENTGAVRKALSEVGYLKAVPGRVKRVMVFTNGDFSQLIQRRARRLGAEPIQMMVCKLPAHLDAVLSEILNEASYEQRAAE